MCLCIRRNCFQSHRWFPVIVSWWHTESGRLLTQCKSCKHCLANMHSKCDERLKCYCESIASRWSFQWSIHEKVFFSISQFPIRITMIRWNAIRSINVGEKCEHLFLNYDHMHTHTHTNQIKLIIIYNNCYYAIDRFWWTGYWFRLEFPFRNKKSFFGESHYIIGQLGIFGSFLCRLLLIFNACDLILCEEAKTRRCEARRIKANVYLCNKKSVFFSSSISNWFPKMKSNQSDWKWRSKCDSNWF